MLHLPTTLGREGGLRREAIFFWRDHPRPAHRSRCMPNITFPPGAILLAQQFHPRHKLSIPDVSPVLGMSRDGLYKRIRTGKIGLKVRRDELGKQWILLSDLIAYLFPEISDSISMTAMPSEALFPSQEKRKRCRPPGSNNKPKISAPPQNGVPNDPHKKQKANQCSPEPPPEP